jgi:C-terminal processing protease CtpA/Prc
LQHAISDFVSASGTRLEGRGVVPDEPVALTREALLRSHDPVLDAAIEWIASKAVKREAALSE